MDAAAVLLVTSTLLVVALFFLTISLMRIRYSTAQLEASLEDAHEARDRAALLLAVSSAVNSSLALGEVLNVALEQVGKIMGAIAGAIYLVAPAKAEVHRQAAYGLVSRARGGTRKFTDDPVKSPTDVMRPVVMHLDVDDAPGLEEGGHPAIALVVPIQRSGSLMGTIELYLRYWKDLTDDQTDLLIGVAAQTALAIRHAQLFQAQEDSALTDELTHLPNRRYMAQRFLQEMQRSRRHHKPMAFMMIDLDHFKEVNDKHGHLTGDAVLSQVATILNSAVRESDVCARYGGEEFAIILHETSETGARILGERIRAKVEASELAAGLRLTISMGVAATDEPALLGTLIERADEALYGAKQGGRNQVRVADLTAVPVPAE